MTKLSRIASMTALLLAASSARATVPNPEPESASSQSLLVWFSDHAEVDPRKLEAAIHDARHVLADAGIETAWIVCTRPNQQREMPAACRVPSGPWILRVRLLSEQSVRQFPVSDANFGMAFPGEGDRLGSAADVFAERSRQFAEKMDVAETLVLGRVLAHEVGHLLLGRNSHSVSGIMKARWKKKQLELAQQGSLGFVGRQAHAMQRQVARRLAVR